MERNSKTDIFRPPKLGVRLLEIFLPLDIAENEIGDLEEEYCSKATQEGIKKARGWFWAQVFTTLRITIREDGYIRIFLGKAMQWCRRPDWVLAMLLDGGRIIQQPFMACVTVPLTLFCLLQLYSTGRYLIKLEAQPTQRQAISYKLRAEELSKPPVLSQKKQAYESITLIEGKSLVQARSKPRSHRPQLIVPSYEANTSQDYEARAFTMDGRTASGMRVADGVIAADPSVLPLGTRVRLEAGPYSGEYIVADMGSAVRGRKIDVWVPSMREASRFGRRQVKLSTLGPLGK